jgi:adenylate cyclase
MSLVDRRPRRLADGLRRARRIADYTPNVGDTNPTEEWRALLTGEHEGVLALRRTFARVPSAPHCKLCHAPFGGIGGLILGPWFGPWERNTQLCKNCMRGLIERGVGGAEVELSLLFADIRGSTGLGERLRPAEFSGVLSAFYRIAAAAIVANEGVVDKFVGDEAIGLFIPGFSGADHAAKAIAAGRAILEAASRTNVSLSGAIPVGAGVHTGIAYVGSLGSSAQISDFTALGDAVNTTARLASLAEAGELLVSVETSERAGLDAMDLERRTVDVRGREAGLDVYTVRTNTTATA